MWTIGRSFPNYNWKMHNLLMFLLKLFHSSIHFLFCGFGSGWQQAKQGIRYFPSLAILSRSSKQGGVGTRRSWSEIRATILAPLAVLLRATSGCQKSKSRDPWPQIWMCLFTVSCDPPQWALRFSDWWTRSYSKGRNTILLRLETPSMNISNGIGDEPEEHVCGEDTDTALTL